MPKTLRVGIVGAGGIARHYHLPSYRRCEGVQVVAACDVDKAALQAMKDEHDVRKLYKDYRELLANERLDILSICTTNDMHYPVAMAAIERGVDIYCEKPLAMTYAQAREMHDAAQAKGIKTGVNFSHRRTPACQLAKEIVDSGALGKIHYVSAIYAAGSPDFASRPGTWRQMREYAGFGGLGDMGAHVIDMMLWWLGCDVHGVAAQMATIVPQRLSHDTGKPMQVTTEDHGHLLLDYSNDALGYLLGGYTFTGRGYDQRVELYGTDGGLMYNQQRPYELLVYLKSEYLERYTILRAGGTRDTPYTTILVPERLQGVSPGASGARRTVLMDYVDAYRAPGEFSFSPGFREGMRVQEVLEAARRAEQARCWVSLPL